MDNIKTEKINQEVLKDTRNGTIVDWRGHKLESLKLAESYVRLENYGKSERVSRCGSMLSFRVQDDGQKLHRANFCKVRLCPMCAWRRSLKVFGQTSKVMDCTEQTYEYRYIFVTLTVKNVSGDDLAAEMDSLFRAFNALTKRTEFLALSRGWFRCLEVTHNWERNDYHPHFHVIVAVEKKYFRDAKTYMNQKSWVKMWQSCLNVDYEPSVDVRAVKPGPGPGPGDGKQFSRAVAEVAKYTVKSCDILGGKTDYEIDTAVEVVDGALHGRRLIAYGGHLRDAHKLLNLDDAENGDLVNTDNDDELRSDIDTVIVKYKWMVGIGNYIMEQ